MNFFQAHGPKTMKLFITKSCGDAKLELFPGARPPDTTFTSWYDLTLALVDIYIYGYNELGKTGGLLARIENDNLTIHN